jgi:hypothetical protein
MSDDSLARNHSAAPPGADADFDVIHATIVATERGRWFLDEYARRRQPDNVLARPDEPPPSEAGRAEALWGMTVAPLESARDAATTATDPESEVSITDWAFAPADPAAWPAPARAPDRLLPLDIASEAEPPPEEPPMSPLERLEAREYGRQRRQPRSVA